MKHDLDLIRHILDHVAKNIGKTDSVEIPTPTTHSSEAVAKHVTLLIEHKLLNGSSHIVNNFTKKGHALQQALHDKDVLTKIKHAGKHLSEGITIEVILDIAKAFLTEL